VRASGILKKEDRFIKKEINPMAGSDVHPTHIFKPWQVWPGSYDNPPADGNFPFPGNQRLRINASTPIVSMGSCFAREIKDVLIKRGYHYITEEKNHPASKHASAAWERTYNLFCMRQIFEYTFNEWTPCLRWWKTPVTGKIQDPYRRIILYDTQEEAAADFEHHRTCSYAVLKRAKLLILTLGLTEIWVDKEDGAVISLPSGPYVSEGGDMSRYDFRVSRYEENFQQLEKIHDIMKINNPSCEILVTVSPVNLWATFREDLDVISAGANSKAILRAVADEFVSRHDNVHYFPCFEMAAVYQPLMGLPWFTEGRENFHVNPDTIDFIMKHFFRFFSENKEAFELSEEGKK